MHLKGKIDVVDAGDIGKVALRILAEVADVPSLIIEGTGDKE